MEDIQTNFGLKEKLSWNRILEEVNVSTLEEQIRKTEGKAVFWAIVINHPYLPGDEGLPGKEETLGLNLGKFWTHWNSWLSYYKQMEQPHWKVKENIDIFEDLKNSRVGVYIKETSSKQKWRGLIFLRSTMCHTKEFGV